MTLFEILAFFLKPVFLLLEPYVKQVTEWITSSAFQRKVIKFVVGLTVLILLVGISFLAYVSFYWLYIPQRGHVGQIHLQYDRPTPVGIIGHGPIAEVDFLRGGRYGQFLRGDQAYDISINLHVPSSEKNVAIGNFMVTVDLQRADGTTIMVSSRPAILTYQSLPLRLMRTAWKAVPLVLDWSQEDQQLKIPLVENFVEDSLNPVARALIQISTPDLQVYKSTIHIVAHFHGLRYFMYYYKISTALVFMSIFIFWEIIFSVVTWQVLAAWFGSDSEALAIAHQINQQSSAPRTQPGQLGHAPRAPSNNAIRSQVQVSSSSPRQPQLQEHSQKYRNAPESELEDERDLLASASRIRSLDSAFNRDESDDDFENNRTQPSILRDDAVVPQRPLTPTQRRTISNEERTQQNLSTAVPLPKSFVQRSTVETDDGASTSSTTTTTTRRTGGRSGLGMSMSTSSSSQVPPPPPPSVLSERSSDLTSLSGAGVGGRRTAVESEYTEEEYVEEGEDELDDDGDVTFDEDDFTDAAHLTRSPSSVRSRQNRSSESGHPGTSENTGRTTGRA